MPHSTSPERGSDANPPIPIPAPTLLQQVRTGKLKQYGDLTIPTGIYKDVRSGSLHIDKVGLPEDEHDLTFHGGPDKAIHQYSTDHYPEWRGLYPDPDVSARFEPGGFGENLVASGWDERNVCIGDKVRIGHADGADDEVGGHHGALLEVSIPRQPCFKLNQKFKIRNFAPKTHERAWTGWYYRVLVEGDIQAGMELRIIDRPNERWTIERMHHYVHRDTKNKEIMEELVKVDALGMETKRPFLDRLKKMNENAATREPEKWRDFRVAEIKDETGRIKSLILEAVQPDEDEKESDIEAGSHIRLRLPNGLIRAHSVVSGTTRRFVLGISREENSRGGSAYIHDQLKQEQIIEVGRITESVDVNSQASHHVIIAGGIGITAFLDVMTLMDKIGFNYELHYAVRNTNDIPFKEVLEPKKKRSHIYHSSKGERMDIEAVLKNRKWNSHIYVCGPQRMADGVQIATKALGISDEEVHYEAFQALTEGEAFEAEVVVDGDRKQLKVAEKQTLLEVMRDSGFDMPSSCEVGNCGTCKVKVLSGEVEHRGTSKVGDGEMLSCVSRGKGKICVEMLEEE